MKVNVTYNEESKYDVGDLVMVEYVHTYRVIERTYDRPALITGIYYSKVAHQFMYNVKIYADKNNQIEQKTMIEKDILYKFLHVVEGMDK